MFDALLLFLYLVGNMNSQLLDAILVLRDLPIYLNQLILAGGWIETLYFSTQIAVKEGNQDVINRIGEQKYTLNNIVKMLTPYYNQPEYDVLVDDLIELAYDFDAIDIQYTYEKPEVDIANKTTKINSKTEVVITPEHLQAIADKVGNIRNKIVGQ